MLVVLGDVVDQAFVQRPGVDRAFPVVHHGVAEAEGFTLRVGLARDQPGVAGGLQGFFAGLGDQRVDCTLQHLGGVQGVAKGGFGDVGIVLHHGLHGSVVDLGGRGGLGGSRSGCLAGGGILLVVAATGEGNGDGQQTGACPGHTSHDGFLKHE
ncbi:hypothetical protein D9M71_708560 [compost metagenome]